ncbi:uncharacterized protein M6B38_315555 [Iris pallida]|uniref:Centromere protein C n=1 Tax=Iris pallida TaxID=29817 RepID=A0AAX6HEP5_IRIPA|nr:uncharacterized protein M6B38_315555 [Iris pallida]
MGEKCSNYGTSADASFGLDDTSHAEANTTVGNLAVNIEAANDNSRSPKSTLAVDQGQSGLSTSRKRNDEGNTMASGASPNRGRKVKAVAHRRERKSSILKRQSLADAGMLWKSGLRRSSRIRSRPLEYWRGERFLYGRIHDSLTTVIGVKCASPGNTELKVKSFVPDKYADLVAQAALH